MCNTHVLLVHTKLISLPSIRHVYKCTVKQYHSMCLNYNVYKLQMLSSTLIIMQSQNHTKK